MRNVEDFKIVGGDNPPQTFYLRNYYNIVIAFKIMAILTMLFALEV